MASTAQLQIDIILKGVQQSVSGVSKLSDSLDKLTNALSKTTTGNNTFRQSNNKISEGLRDTVKEVDTIVSQWRTYIANTNRSADETELFGNAAKDLANDIKLLNDTTEEGSADMKKLGQMASQLKTVISGVDNEIKKAAKSQQQANREHEKAFLNAQKANVKYANEIGKQIMATNQMYASLFDQIEQRTQKEAQAAAKIVQEEASAAQKRMQIVQDYYAKEQAQAAKKAQAVIANNQKEIAERQKYVASMEKMYSNVFAPILQQEQERIKAAQKAAQEIQKYHEQERKAAEKKAQDVIKANQQEIAARKKYASDMESMYAKVFKPVLDLKDAQDKANTSLGKAEAAFAKVQTRVSQLSVEFKKQAASGTMTDASFKKMQKEANRLVTQIGNLSKVSGLSTKQLNQMASAINKVSSIAPRSAQNLKQLTDLTKQSSRGFAGSTNAAINFNRVISDMPYGIQGVANNLEMALFSFREVTKGTQGFSGALKALGKTMFTGSGAILTAITVIPTAIIMLQKYFKSAKDGAASAKEQAEEYAKALDSLLKKKLGTLNLGDQDALKAEKKAIEEIIKADEQRLKNLQQTVKDRVSLLNAEGEGYVKLKDNLSGLAQGFVQAFGMNATDEIDEQSESVEQLRERLKELENQIKANIKARKALSNTSLSNQDDGLSTKESARILKENIDAYSSITAAVSQIRTNENRNLSNLQKQKQVIEEIISSGRVDEAIQLASLSMELKRINEDIRLETSGINNELSQQILLQRILNRERQQASFAPNIGRVESEPNNIGVNGVAPVWFNEEEINRLNEALIQANPNVIKFVEGYKQIPMISAEQLALANGIQSAVEGIAMSFADGLTDIKNFGDAFQNMGNVIVNSLKQIIARLIVIKTLGVIGGLIGGSVGSFITQSVGSRLIGSNPSALNPAATSSKSALNANLFINGRQLNTETRFSTFRQNQLGF